VFSICVVALPSAVLKFVPPAASRPAVRESTKVESGLTEMPDTFELPLDSKIETALGALIVPPFISLL